MKSSQILKALHKQNLPLVEFLRGTKSQQFPRGNVFFFFVNTNPSYKPGEHWVAFFITPSKVYYFDPYGIPPTGF